MCRNCNHQIKKVSFILTIKRNLNFINSPIFDLVEFAYSASLGNIFLYFSFYCWWTFVPLFSHFFLIILLSFYLSFYFIKKL